MFKRFYGFIREGAAHKNIEAPRSINRAMPELCFFPSFLWKEVPRRGGGWLGSFLSLGQPLALRAFPFQRKGIDESRFLLSNFRVSPWGGSSTDCG